MALPVSFMGVTARATEMGVPSLADAGPFPFVGTMDTGLAGQDIKTDHRHAGIIRHFAGTGRDLGLGQEYEGRYLSDDICCSISKHLFRSGTERGDNTVGVGRQDRVRGIRLHQSPEPCLRGQDVREVFNRPVYPFNGPFRITHDMRREGCKEGRAINFFHSEQRVFCIPGTPEIGKYPLPVIFISIEIDRAVLQQVGKGRNTEQGKEGIVCPDELSRVLTGGTEYARADILYEHAVSLLVHPEHLFEFFPGSDIHEGDDDPPGSGDLAGDN